MSRSAGLLISLVIFAEVILIRTNALFNKSFPQDFTFGFATAAYQIEGGWDVDGKGENIWDHITHNHPDFIDDQSNGDVACDSYNKYAEDVELLSSMGAKLYRFSLSWSRILPSGLANSVNQKGIAYYNKLIDALIEKNIEPFITLYHWDLPQKLQNIGGWTNKQIIKYFTEFARVAFDNFGDRVKLWSTINEPNAICRLGYGDQSMAPAIASDGIGEYQCAHNLIRAHAGVYHLFANKYKQKINGKLGFVMDSMNMIAEDERQESLIAQERAFQFSIGFYLHPILHAEGDYPEIVKERIANRSKLEGFKNSRLPQFTLEEISYVRGTADFLGVNHYTSDLVSLTEEAAISNPSYHYDKGYYRYKNESWPGSASASLKVVPEGFRSLLVWLKNEYNSPEIIITENGYSDRGTLNDEDRIDYYKKYLSALLEAIHKDSVNVIGYTAWSLLDNFEWFRGYTEKYGLVNVNFTDNNRTRTKKDSAKYYSQVIATRCILETGECTE